MKIAVTYENGQIFSAFWTYPAIQALYRQNGKIISEEIIDSNGSGHGALAGLLASLNVNALICGGIGSGAQEALAQAGIKLFCGVQGSADKAAASLAAGTA